MDHGNNTTNDNTQLKKNRTRSNAMKKTAKFLSLTVALFAGLSGTAQAADGFKIGTDLVSSYVWRGSDWHKIGDVHLADNTDYRITFQSHCVIQQNKLLYYW